MSLALFVAAGMIFGLLAGFVLFSPRVDRETRARLTVAAVVLPLLALLLIVIIGARVELPAQERRESREWIESLGSR